MFGTHPVTISMDSREFAESFDSAFNAKIISYNVDVDANQSIHQLGNSQAVAYNGPALYTVKIACYMPSIPIDRSLMDHFDIKEDSTRLIEVLTSSRCDPDMGLTSHRIELTYRCLDYDKFNHALKNLAYNRFSEQFHKQLEDKLDKV